MSERRAVSPKKKGVTVAKRRTVNLTLELEERLEDLSTKTEMTVPALLRRAVKDLLARYDRDGHI